MIRRFKIAENFIGIVQNSKFKIVYPQSAADSFAMLIEDSVNVGSPIKELSLAKYEGKAILVSGDKREEWI